MSSQTELLWLGAALLLLLLLGMAAGLCVRCSHSEPKRLEKIYQQRSLQETAQSFAVARTYSLVRPVWARPLGDTGPDQASTRKDKLLEFSPSLEEPASPRYQDSSKEGRAESEAASLRPITADYCNWGQLPRSQEEDDDAGSYENVLICKQRTPESGEDSEDYQNSASIHQWQESRRIMEQAAAPLPVGSPDEDSGEPDYVNQDAAAPRV